MFDVWIDVQRRWVYLDGIFSGSADIKALLPVETQRFQRWVQSVHFEQRLTYYRSMLYNFEKRGDQPQFSPNNIRSLSRDKVMRIYEMITEEKML